MSTDYQPRQIWHDLLQNKYYQINQVSGQSKHVEKTGEDIKKFSIELSGKANFQIRTERAKYDETYKPPTVQNLDKPDNKFYQPIQDKFIGYAQFPNITDRIRNRDMCHYLTNSISSFRGEKTYRQVTREPQLTFLQKKLKQIKQKETQQKKELNTIQENLTNNTDQKIFNQPQMFQSKCQSFKNRTKSFNMIDNSYQTKMNFFQSNLTFKENKTFFESTMKSARTENNYKTINNFNKYPKNFTPVGELMENLEKERIEMEGFKVPIQEEKVYIVTKNRFNVPVNTNSEIHVKFDRKIDKQANAESYIIPQCAKRKRAYLNDKSATTTSKK